MITPLQACPRRIAPLLTAMASRIRRKSAFRWNDGELTSIHLPCSYIHVEIRLRVGEDILRTLPASYGRQKLETTTSDSRKH